MTLRGTVTGCTFNSVDNGYGVITNFTRLDERYYLLNGINIESPVCDIDEIYDPGDWGIAIKMLPDLFGENMTSPQNGVEIRVKGRLGSLTRGGQVFAILEEVKGYDVVSFPSDLFPLRLIGDPCSSDMECDDGLICNRQSAVCSRTPMAVEFGSPWHDTFGTCMTDSDCPGGQVCYLDYLISSTDENDGKHLCVLAENTGSETLCPRIGSTADLAGGRYVTGKEVCIRGTVLLFSDANYDGDDHLQLRVSSPKLYPEAKANYALFGATTEIAPFYKDPNLGMHAVNPPQIGDRIIVLGTYRYEDAKGWFEVHPVKAWWPDE